MALFKVKVEMGLPQNYRPLCILIHASKVVEKPIVTQLEEIEETDVAQYGFQE